MSLTERFREYRHRNAYENPIKKSERAPIARGLIDVIKVSLDNTPEYLRAFNNRQTQFGDDLKTASLPIEWNTDDGHFSVLKEYYPNRRGITTESYAFTFESKAEGDDKESNRIELKVAVESNTPVPPDVYGHLYVGPLPYDVGNFSFALLPVKLDAGKLIPNSPHTRDVISETVRMLLPTFDRNRKIGVSDR